jgi:hypothetical protein
MKKGTVAVAASQGIKYGSAGIASAAGEVTFAAAQGIAGAGLGILGGGMNMYSGSKALSDSTKFNPKEIWASARNIFEMQYMNMQMLGFGVRCAMFKPEMSTWIKNPGNFQLVTIALSHVFAVQELLATTTKNMDNGKKPPKIPKDLFPTKKKPTKKDKKKN